MCVGPPGWHHSGCAGCRHGHMLSKPTHEWQRWAGDGGFGVSYARTVRQSKGGWGVRKRHGKSAHQRHVTICHMSMHSMKQPLNQKAESKGKKKHLLFSGFHFKKDWI